MKVISEAVCDLKSAASTVAPFNSILAIWSSEVPLRTSVSPALMRDLPIALFASISGALILKAPSEYNQNLFKLEDLFDNDKELEDDDEEVKAKEEMLELLYKYMKEKLSPDAYMVFEVLLTPPPYIKERIKDGERITNIMLVEFFDMPRTKKSVKYIGELKQDILYWEEKAKEELHY